MSRKEIPFEQRCPTTFERRSKGKRYVYARWQCPRKKLKGKDYCSYCTPYSVREARAQQKREASS